MKQRVEGIYHNVEEALQAVDRLRDQGYNRDSITIVANEEVRNDFSSNVEADVRTQETDMNRTDSTEEDQSFWESIKDAFTTDDSYDDSNYDDPDYDSENDPVYNHRDAIKAGDIAVLVTGEPSVEGGIADTRTNTDTVEPTRPNSATPGATTPDPGPVNPDAPGSDSINLDPGNPDTPDTNEPNKEPIDTDVTRDNRKDKSDTDDRFYDDDRRKNR